MLKLKNRLDHADSAHEVGEVFVIRGAPLSSSVSTTYHSSYLKIVI